MKNKVKIVRWELGLKQYELASKLECSAPYLSMIENGRVEPTEEFKEKVAALLKVTVVELFPE